MKFNKKVIIVLIFNIFSLAYMPNLFADNSIGDSTITEITTTTESQIITTESASKEDHSSEAIDNFISTQSNQNKDAIGNMLLQSVSLMGIAYKWGGNSPNTGMDCSGFVRYVFKKSLGINLPRTAAEMAKVGKRININNLQPGDLIFFNTKRGSNTHIGIYLGNNKFIQSPRTGENIQITDLSGYWTAHFNGAKRVVQQDQDSEGTDGELENFQNIHNEALPVVSRHNSSKRKHRSKHTKNTVYETITIKNTKVTKKTVHISSSKHKKTLHNKKAGKKAH